MKELIIRITDTSDDVEILENNFLSNQTLEKQLSLSEFARKLETHVTKSSGSKFTPKFLKDGVIAYDTNHGKELYVINQPEHERIVTLDLRNLQKAYRITFPNALYLVKVRDKTIETVEAYSYKTFSDKETSLYEYPMPNMLMGNKVCIGQAMKTIETSLHDALESLIFSPFSHSKVEGIKSFKDTKTYFEYLSRNPFPYNLLKKLNKRLIDCF